MTDAVYNSAYSGANIDSAVGATPEVKETQQEINSMAGEDSPPPTNKLYINASDKTLWHYNAQEQQMEQLLGWSPMGTIAYTIDATDEN